MDITQKEKQVVMQVQARIEQGVDTEDIRDKYLVNNTKIYI